MNSNQFNRKARRAVRKKVSKLGRKLNSGEIRDLKIQSSSLWTQWVLIVLGLLFIGGGIYAQWAHESMLGFVIFCIGGLIFFLLGVFGKKETVEKCAEEIVSQSAECLIDKLVDSL